MKHADFGAEPIRARSMLASCERLSVIIDRMLADQARLIAVCDNISRRVESDEHPLNRRRSAELYLIHSKKGDCNVENR